MSIQTVLSGLRTAVSIADDKEVYSGAASAGWELPWPRRASRFVDRCGRRLQLYHAPRGAALQLMLAAIVHLSLNSYILTEIKLHLGQRIGGSNLYNTYVTLLITACWPDAAAVYILFSCH